VTPKHPTRPLVAFVISLLAAAAAGCGGGAPRPDAAAPDGAAGADGGGAEAASEAGGEGGPGGGGMLTPLFMTAAQPACTFSAPLAITSRGAPEILLATADGTFSALDPATGAEVWRVALTAPPGLAPHLAAAPVVVGSRVVFAWQDVEPDWTRADHHVAVLDLEARALDAAFEPLTLDATKPSFDGVGAVDFLPEHAYSRAALAHADLPGRALGLAYVSFGNVRDLQPWHGWVFEVDLDAWQTAGAAVAVTATLLTTAESDCGAENGDGARQMMCGGGVWSARGPLVLPDDGAPDGFRLVVPTGNGMLDPTRKDFANGLVGTGHGLAFDPGCDPALCAPFNQVAPAEACASSCSGFFIPRLPAGQSVPRGTGDVCVGQTLLGCYAKLDWDLGASSPAAVTLGDGHTVLVMPGKDGALYLVDAAHLGTLYDRLQLTASCGEGDGSCSADWAGTIVTRPAIVTLPDGPVALVPTFMFDTTHPAGLQAVSVVLDGGGVPRLSLRWRAPAFDDPESLVAFRRHPGGVAVAEVGGEPFAVVVDTGAAGQQGTAYLIRVTDGTIVQRVTLQGSGQRFAPPLVAGNVVYVPSCERTGTPDFNEGPSHIEAFTLAAPTGGP
jgi:hypothetical protein